MAGQIYPSELQLNKANTSDTEAAFFDLHLSISNDIVSTKIYDKGDDFDIVNFPRLSSPVWQVRRAPDHFFGRVFFPPCHFFLILAHFSLCLPLIFNLLMQSSIMLFARVIHRPT